MRFTPQTRRLDWLIARPIAHRGFHDRARGVIENTRSAFAAAIAHGYAIECDLQISRDGEAMAFHDDDLDRLTLARGPVKSRGAEELKQVEFKDGRDRMQSLGELLDQVSGRVPLLIELKSHWDGDERLVARTLSVLEPYEGPYSLMSFDPDVIEQVRRRSPFSVRGIVADRATDAFYDFLPVHRRLAIGNLGHLDITRPHFVSFEAAGLPYAPVGRLRAAGKPIISWTIRSPDQVAHARRYSDQITFEGFAA